MRALQLGPGLKLPLEAVTETFALLAVRGAGKSNAARVMAEEMFGAKLPFVAVDPVGSWYGLRAGRDGGQGLSIPIFGGRHGDVQLEKGGGQVLADLIVDERLSCVLDLSSFDSESSKKAFLFAFAQRLYQRNTEPLHLFLEEADDYIPQRPMRDEALLLRAWENIVRRGRARGLGITLITQRSASINKSVLTQTGTLIAMRTTSPQDRAAVEEWLKYHAESRAILESLSSLEAGDAWVWSPQFLKLTQRIHFRRSHTLDSGATPTGRASRAPSTMADVDLGAIQKRMAATIERAKADDPRELRRKIGELERQLATKPAAAPPQKVEVLTLQKGEVKRLEGLAAKLTKAAEKLEVAAAHAKDLVRDTNSAAQATLVAAGRANPATQVLRPGAGGPGPRPATPPALPPSSRRVQATGDGKLQKAERAILTAIAQRQPMPSSRSQVSILSGYSIRSSSFLNALSGLRVSGFIDSSGDRILITEAGVRALGDYPAMPSPQERHAWWNGKLGKAERALLDVVVGHYPAEISRESLSQESGYSLTSSSFLNALSTLRTLELVAGRNELRASADLFE